VKLGSLCSGYGGLDLAVEQVLGARTVWVSEIDPAASRVLAARFPVPNLGDFRDATPESVDILTAGFPCQPVSTAGRRAGIEDERWLFDDIADLVGRMDPRPGLLVFENVVGLLTANDGAALARVVSGLARLGYLGRWRVVRAADVGAPHRRARWFCVAVPADADVPGRSEHGRIIADTTQQPAPEHGRGTPADADGVDAERRRGPAGVAGAVRAQQEQGRQSHQGWDAVGYSGATPADADGATRGPERTISASQTPRRPAVESGRHDCVAWGPYEVAVARWESVLGRPAPTPVDDRGRLNPLLVEWMMGLPAGWVTDILDRRTDALRCLGNGVVPQQAALALQVLL